MGCFQSFIEKTLRPTSEGNGTSNVNHPNSNPTYSYSNVSVSNGNNTSPVSPQNVARRMSERPLPPLPPPPPLPSAKPTILYRAMHDFGGINADDISFKKGDRLEIDEDSQELDDWWTAFNLRTKRKGYVPSNYLLKDDDNPQNQDWWFDVDHRESDKILLSPGVVPGNFLIRPSRDNITFVLSVRDETTVKHYKIRKLDKGGYFISSRRKFATMLDLIDHYKVNVDGMCLLLTNICPRTTPVLHFRDLEVGRDMVTMNTRLGVGHFGEVWRGKLRNIIDVAVKTLKAGTMSPEAFLAEAQNMHHLRHKRLVQLIAVCSQEEPILIITELMGKGSLLDYLRKDGGKTIQFPGITDMASQIAEAMAFLEEMKYIHRDLRAANILVSHTLEVKVADFGLARVLQDGVYDATEKTKFPVKWTAPEAANYRRFSIKSDVWSFGIVLNELITFGKVPYPGMGGLEVLRNIDKGYRMPKPFSPILYTDAYYEVMLTCWHGNPEDRPTFSYLHDLFDNFDIATEQGYDETNQG